MVIIGMGVGLFFVSKGKADPEKTRLNQTMAHTKENDDNSEAPNPPPEGTNEYRSARMFF